MLLHVCNMFVEKLIPVSCLFSGFVELQGLTTDDHVTLTIIEHYMDFKVWFSCSTVM